MNKTLFGCSYTDLWVSPADWKTTTAKSSLAKPWYVQCVFYDPKFKDSHPKGRVYRRRLNSIPDLNDRKRAVEFLLKEIPDIFNQGYNHIAGVYMIPEKSDLTADDIGPGMPFLEALQFGYDKADLADTTSKDIEGILKKIGLAAQRLGYNQKSIGEITRKNIMLLFDDMEKKDGRFSGHKFNKYRGYLQIIYKKLRSYEVVDTNIITDIDKRKAIRNLRETLTPEERQRIAEYLQPRFPEFLDFCILYFHSGGRLIELLRMSTNDVDLEKRRYKSLIKKGAAYKWVYRPIKEIAVPTWQRVLKNSKKGQIIFSEGLCPGDSIIRRDQVSRRWRTHVKDKLNITADLTALKHTNLDEIEAAIGIELAAKAAAHTDTTMVRRHYAVNKEQRDNEALRNMKNEFAPLRAV